MDITWSWHLLWQVPLFLAMLVFAGCTAAASHEHSKRKYLSQEEKDALDP